VSVTEGPFGESREVIGGFYTIEAESFDEAVKLSLENPHLVANSKNEFAARMWRLTDGFDHTRQGPERCACTLSVHACFSVSSSEA
jgi:hypothetical protein